MSWDGESHLAWRAWDRARGICEAPAERVVSPRPTLSVVLSRSTASLHDPPNAPRTSPPVMRYRARASVINEAFFGLVGSGWNVDDFAQPGAAARMPLQALWAENIVGLLDLERGTGNVMTVAQFNEALTVALRGQRLETFRPICEAELTRVRSLCAELRARWDAVPPGDTLEVTFPITTAES